MKAAMAKMSKNFDAKQEERERQNKKKAANQVQGGAKTFSRGQVAQHNNMNDCWIILAGKVYDVTKFIMDHPGGSFHLLNSAGDGKDHIDDFEEQGHSKGAKNQLRKYYIGDVA